MMRAVSWLVILVIVAAAGHGWAAPADRTTAAAASAAEVDRLEALLDETDQLDEQLAALAKQAAAARGPAEQQHLQAQLETLQRRRTELAAQLEPLLPAFPRLQQRWNAHQTAERASALEAQVNQQLQRQEVLLDATANERVRQ